VTHDRIRVLVVEDDPSYADLVRQSLAESGSPRFVMDHVSRLTDAIARVTAPAEGADYDVLLLDLHLPDSRGLETFLRLRTVTRDLAIIALTVLDDQALAVQVLQNGAQDYLVKGEVDPDLLARAIRYAVERVRAERRLREQEERLQRAEAEARDAAVRLKLLTQELQAVERLVRRPRTGETARTYGVVSLREGAPEVFDDLVRRYHDLLELALEERTHKVEHHVSDGLRTLADQLGFLHARPRDVVEIHSTVVNRGLHDSNVIKAQAYLDVGRLRVLELMGYLASYYRHFAVGVR
jgi:DNA-binding response OmpR family regulator